MGLISTGPGSPLAFSSASGGKVYGYNNINETTARVVAQANPSRQKITFHNPGTSDIFISPSFVRGAMWRTEAMSAPISCPLSMADASS